MTTYRRFLLPAVLWTCVVLLASFDLFSARNTGSILEALITTLFGKVQPHTFELLHFLVRKSAHVTEYGILSVLWFLAWRGAREGHQWIWSMGGIGIALATAITDEVHQSFVPSRTGEVRDVLLDVAAAITVQVVLWLFLSRRRAAPERA